MQLVKGKRILVVIVSGKILCTEIYYYCAIVLWTSFCGRRSVDAVKYRRGFARHKDPALYFPGVALDQ
jgi:hypothetical protein